MAYGYPSAEGGGSNTSVPDPYTPPDGTFNVTGGVNMTGDGTMASLTVTQVATWGTPTLATLTGAANTTNLPASAEVLDVSFNLARTVTFATGALTTQRAVDITAPTYAFAGASTLTTAATVSIDGAPQAGTNATITNNAIIRVGGAATLGPTSATMQYAAYDTTAHTVTVTGTTHVTSTPAFAMMRLQTLTITDASAVTIDRAATLYIATAPVAAGSVTLTNKYSIYVAAGNIGTDGSILPITNGTPDIGSATADGAASDLGFLRIYVSGGGKFQVIGGMTVSDNLIQSLAGTTTALTIRGGLAAASASTDVLVRSNVARTAGNLFQVANTTTNVLTVDFAGGTTHAQTTAWATALWTLTGAANTTNLAASVEVSDAAFNLARTVTFATGALTEQRAVTIAAPTYAFAGASTLSLASTVSISGPPVAGTNATLTTKSALTIESGQITVYNTADRTTNYERMQIGFAANLATIQMVKGGTGTSRTINLLTNDGSGVRCIDNAAVHLVGSSGGYAALAIASDSIAMYVLGKVTTSTNPNIYLGNTASANINSASSGVQVNVIAAMPLNQSGTAGYTALKVAATETTLGSGTKLLLDLQAHATTPVSRFSVANDAATTWTQPTTWTSTLITLTGGANTTNLAASTEVSDANFNLARTVTWATGAITGQRAINITAPTFAFVGASTITVAATLAIDAAPKTGANATITTSAALTLGVSGATTTASADAAEHALIYMPDYTWTLTGTTTQTHASSQSMVRIGQLTVTDASAVTLNSVSALYIKGAPLAAGSVTLTKSYSIFIDAGLPRIDSTTANGTVATAMSSLGPAGSNTTIQEWLTIDINGTTRYIPCF